MFDVGNPNPRFGQTQTCAWFNIRDNWISNDICIYKQAKRKRA